jgi:hypothetical protein
MGARNISFSITCLRTLIDKSEIPLRLIVHSDGSLGPDHEAAIREGVAADVGFVHPEEANDVVLPHLAKRPALRAFRDRDVMVKKLVDVTLMERGPRMMYCDSDIIFFRKYAGLFGVAQENEAMFMHDVRSCYAFGWNPAARRLFAIPERLNAGLIDYPTRAFDLDLVEHILQTRTFTNKLWEEQTIWAVLASRLKSFYPAEVIVPVPRSDPRDSLAWHLVTPLREVWSLSELIKRTADPSEEAFRPTLRPFRLTGYPRYIALRTAGGLARRARGLKQRLAG